MRAGTRISFCFALLMLAPMVHGEEVSSLFNSEDFVVRGNDSNDYYSPGAFAEIEMLFLKYHRAEGVRVGTGADDSGSFDFELTPRITLGYQGSNGLGARISYWEFDHRADIGTTAGQFIDVNTYVIDAEFYRKVQFGANWHAEFSGGVRYQDWHEMLNEPPSKAYFTDFDGFGVSVGFELEHYVTSLSSLYVHGKFAIVMGDGITANGSQTPFMDRLSQQTELGIGVEHTREMACGDIFFRLGLEVWEFDGLSAVFDADTDFDDTSAVGFGGAVFKIGYNY